MFNTMCTKLNYLKKLDSNKFNEDSELEEIGTGEEEEIYDKIWGKEAGKDKEEKEEKAKDLAIQTELQFSPKMHLPYYEGVNFIKQKGNSSRREKGNQMKYLYLNKANLRN